MSASLAALLGFVALTLGLVIIYVGYRTMLVFARKTPANSWTRNAETWDDPAFIRRVQHAHLNCLENLPLFAALVLFAVATDQLAVTDGLAFWYLGFRLAQSAIHLAGAGPWLVFARANMLIGQWVILIYWLLKLAGLV